MFLPDREFLGFFKNENLIRQCLPAIDLIQNPFPYLPAADRDFKTFSYITISYLKKLLKQENAY